MKIILISIFFIMVNQKNTDLDAISLSLSQNSSSNTIEASISTSCDDVSIHWFRSKDNDAWEDYGGTDNEVEMPGPDYLYVKCEVSGCGDFAYTQLQLSN